MRRILTILMLAAVSAATAQERFDYIFRRNPWNGGPNAAGIRQDSLSRSYAEIYFTKENGGLTGHSASDDSWNAGAKTESVRHLKKVSFSGGFGYDYFDGRNMCGSMFTEPGYYPAPTRPIGRTVDSLKRMALPSRAAIITSALPLVSLASISWSPSRMTMAFTPFWRGRE